MFVKYYYRLFKRVLILCGVFASLASATARAVPCCNFPSPNLPPIDGKYVSPEDFHALFDAGKIKIIDVIHSGFTDSFPPPPPAGSTTHSFDSTVNGKVSMDGGLTYTPFSASAAVTVKVDSTSDVGDTRFFDTEMMQLDISLPGGGELRESPTLGSTGKTTIEDMGGGQFCISSFFDIFVELSADGGQTWLPQENGPTHMVLSCPDGGSTSLLLIVPALALTWLGRTRKA